MRTARERRYGRAVMIVGVSLALGLSGCDRAADSGGAQSSASEATSATTDATSPTVADNTPALPSHNWTVKEGQDYGYAAALSDDDRRAGRGASQVLMFHYLGVNSSGQYVVESYSNGTIMQAACAKPCEVIHVAAPGADDHITFNPETVIGMVLTDAMNGQLEIFGSHSPAAAGTTPPPAAASPPAALPPAPPPPAPAPVQPTVATPPPAPPAVEPTKPVQAISTSAPASDVRSSAGFRQGWSAMAWCVVNLTPRLVHERHLDAEAIKLQAHTTCAGDMIAANYLSPARAYAATDWMVDKRMGELAAAGWR